MSEEKRRSYAVDDVEFIARRLKEIQEEKAEAVNDLPCDVEPTLALKKTYTLDELTEIVTTTLRDFQADDDVVSNTELLERLAKKTTNAFSPSIYGDSFWQRLLETGVIKVGEA